MFKGHYLILYLRVLPPDQRGLSYDPTSNYSASKVCQLLKLSWLFNSQLSTIPSTAGLDQTIQAFYIMKNILPHRGTKTRYQLGHRA